MPLVDFGVFNQGVRETRLVKTSFKIVIRTDLETCLLGIVKKQMVTMVIIVIMAVMVNIVITVIIFLMVTPVILVNVD
jgi:hypothetical protein